MSPFIDYALCVGCGACAEIYPELFELRDGQAWVINHEAFDLNKHRAAVDICIYGAISIRGDMADETISASAPASRGRRGRRGRGGR